MMYSREQQKANRESLVEALRSGDYEQGIMMLRHRSIDEDSGKQFDRFCCLGVACEISLLGSWENVGKSLSESVRFTVNAPEVASGFYQASTSTLPGDVRDFYGFATETGTFRPNNDTIPSNNDGITSLIDLNDGGFTFEQIALIIENEVGGLVK